MNKLFLFALLGMAIVVCAIESGSDVTTPDSLVRDDRKSGWLNANAAFFDVLDNPALSWLFRPLWNQPGESHPRHHHHSKPSQTKPGF
uniref:Secreted protein n=1 Tax=Panagrolaimus sp. JU765 TaxID=591449 RepID=A0AC34RQF9_9BILA